MASKPMERAKVEAEVKTEPKAEEKKKKFNQDDKIACRSVIDGVLNMEGLKTKNLYSWRDYGDIEYVEYADLVSAVRTKSGFVFNPWFIVDDEDFVNENSQLKKFYTENYSVKELREIIDMPINKMVEAIKALPPSAVESLKSIAASAITSGGLDSVKKIKALDEAFGTDLNLLATLSGE